MCWKTTKVGSHSPYRRRARRRCNIYTDHHPGNKSLRSVAGVLKRVEKQLQQRLEQSKGPNRGWKRRVGVGGRGTGQSPASTSGCFQ